tara:strand:+ start:1389 stop:1649 length:261 start_codon:yes stop_codon:yes gene_type:complete
MVTEKDFEQHLADNPRIYPMFVDFAVEASMKNKHYSAQAVIERIRWETNVHENNSKFKFSHNWRSFYAKKFMKEHPQYDGFFRTRS